jgi:uncharacterized membrane protein YsdA (DUF1294 family)/cold shock CspA family protein
MNQTGKIIKWNDEKGFGFIQSETGKEAIFFHISAFRSPQKRPVIGMAVIFSAQKDNQGRLKADKVTLAGDETSHPAVAAFFIASTFLLFISLIALLGHLPKIILWLYIIASLISVALYYSDKTAAQRNQQRFPEATLHQFALIGGWPGALFSQQFFRHKSKKQSFRNIFWVTVFANIVLLILLLSPYGTPLRLFLDRLIA